jgi:transposase-like protein
MVQVGDYVETYCSKCKRPSDHSVVAMEGDKVTRVRCRTCDYDHSYRAGQTGKKEMTKEEAFNKVLASVMGTMPGGMPEEKPKGKKKK